MTAEQERAYMIGRIYGECEVRLRSIPERAVIACAAPEHVALQAQRAGIDVDTTDWPESLDEELQGYWWLGYWHRKAELHSTEEGKER